jgi:chorismate mutase/prephenate dehydratase
MASTPPNLADLRDEIDALDDQLLELLEKRMRVAIEVARLKGDDGLLKLRPKREGAIVRRLSAKATIASDALIAHVWREMMAHSRQSQAAMEVHLYAPRHGAILREAARNRFGRVTPIVEATSAAATIAAATTGEVVAMIELDTGAWRHELPSSVRLFGVLGTGNARAALVGRMDEVDIPDEERAAIAGLGA